MSQYESVVRALRCLASWPGETEGAYDHLRVEEEELIEERITSDDRQELTVSQPVKQNTPAAYLVQSSTERLAFWLGADNDVRYAKFDNDSDDWPGDTQTVGPAKDLHEQTRLAAGRLNEAASIFYQDSEGRLNHVSTSDFAVWEHHGPLTAAVSPVHGTCLQAIPLGPAELRLYYTSEDGYAHYLSLSGPGNETDNKVEYAHVGGSKIQNLIAYPTENNDFGIFTLNEQSIIDNYLPATGKTKIGNVTDTGELVLVNKDEFFNNVSCVSVPVTNNGNNNTSCTIQ